MSFNCMGGQTVRSETSLGVCWITVRKVSDLCSTTTLALANGIIEAGHNLTFLNPDEIHKHESYPWMQHELHRSLRKGFQATSIAKSAMKWFDKHTTHGFDMILVDWQLAKKLVPYFQKRGLPMILMDRSPPADASLFGRLQWHHWKKAWRHVQSGKVSRGCVVSLAHREFVQKKFSIPSEQIHILPAGVDLIRFKPNLKASIESKILLVYHGRLDKHRGILALPMLVQKLQNRNIDARLTIIGEGDALKDLENMSRKFPWLKIHSKMQQESLAKILSVQHVGLLPMPNSKVWSLASPLKRSEYLASGLLVFGIKHEGHNLQNTQTSWFNLVEQYDFHVLGIDWIQSLNNEIFNQGSRLAREYAEKFCSWTEAIKELESAIQFARDAS